MKKTLLFSIIAVLVIILAVGIFSNTASAADEHFYSYTIENSKATITAVDKSISGDITIPSTLSGYPVTKINTSVFGDCNNLTSVIIPDTVTSIGSSLFLNCKSLKSVTLSNKITHIGSQAAFCYAPRYPIWGSERGN